MNLLISVKGRAITNTKLGINIILMEGKNEINYWKSKDR